MAKKKKIVLTITITGTAAAVYRAFAELLGNAQYDRIPVEIEKVSEEPDETDVINTVKE